MTASINDRLNKLEQRLDKVEKLAHEPFDFTDLIKRLETLEQSVDQLSKDVLRLETSHA